MDITRGYRTKLSDLFNVADEIKLKIRATGTNTCDFCCFGLDQSDKLSDDRYMIFYNQPAAPHHEISCQLENNEAVYSICLSRLPDTIEKLVFTLNGDDDVLVSAFQSFEFELSQGAQILTAALRGAEFQQEKAIIAFEIYKKQGLWRMNYVARGYNGGLSKLLAEFGGEELTEEEAPPAQGGDDPSAEAADALTQNVMQKVSLAKDREKLEHHVVSLSKCVTDLSKKGGFDLGAVRAKVVVVLDYSGSMAPLYADGTVQDTINRLVPLGLTFDDNGAIDVYLFSEQYQKMDDLNLENYESYVEKVVLKSDISMRGTFYSYVLEAIIGGGRAQKGGIFFFFDKIVNQPAPSRDGNPTFVLFITDGDCFDRPMTDKLIRKSSSMNLFIQFVGIGKEEFSYLAQLDDLGGRARDNTGFSKMEDLRAVDDRTLYMALLEQFSRWMKGEQ